MKELFTICMLFLLISCEENQLEELSVISESEPAIQEQVCHFFANHMEYPSFPGGDAAALKFIEENIRYPPICAEGRVFVWFVVEKNGAITNVEIARGMSREHDAEAIRLVNLFPKWEPGKQYSIPVRTKMVIPIFFRF